MVEEWRDRRVVTVHRRAGRRATARCGVDDIGGRELIGLLDPAAPVRDRSHRSTVARSAYGYRWLRVAAG